MAAAIRYRWFIVAVTVLGGALGYVATRFILPEYSVQATLRVERADQVRAAEASRAWAELLRSDAVLEPVVAERVLQVEPRSARHARALVSFAGLADGYEPGEYRLAVDARGERFTLSDGAGQVVQRGLLGDSIGPALGFLWQPVAGDLSSGDRIRFRVIERRAAIDQLAADLRTAYAPPGYLIVELVSRAPERAAATLNSVADGFADVAGSRVVESARVPASPVRDARGLLAVLVVIGSLGAALAGAAVLDRSDPRVRYPVQVRRELGLPVLGVVPRAEPRNGALAPEDEDQIAEAFRSVKTSLLYARGGSEPIMLTVSSPDQGDGKSFVTANLALAFANHGLATVLVDGDTRRGHLHRLFQLQRKPGLMDWLRGGDGDVQDIVQATEHPSLHFIAGGSRAYDGQELLGSPAARRLIPRLRERFSVVVVDSPSLRTGVDPLLLAAMTGNVMLVLRTGVTDRELAGAKLELFDGLPVRVVGAVLNDVPARGLYSRYAGYATHIGVCEKLEDPAISAEERLSAPAAVGG